MPDDAAQSSASAPEPSTFAEYRASKTVALSEAAPEPQPADAAKAAPDSDPELPQEPKGKDLTDSEKADRKARNDRRREERWWEERGRMRAETERLQRELAEAKQTKPPSEEPKVRVDGKPKLEQFTGSGKYNNWDDANDAYLDARDEWNRQQWQAEQGAASARDAFVATKTAYQQDVTEFVKAHEDYPDVFQGVKERLDGESGTGNALTTALLKSKNPSALIYHLGTNDDLLGELGDLVDAGDFESALIRLGEIKAELKPGKAAAPPAPVPPKETPNTPKPPRHVAGRGTAPPSREDQQRTAAEADDFRTFRKASRVTA